MNLGKYPDVNLGFTMELGRQMDQDVYLGLYMERGRKIELDMDPAMWSFDGTRQNPAVNQEL